MQDRLFDLIWGVFEWLLVALGSVVFTGAGIRFEEVGRAALAAANLQHAAVDFLLAAVMLVWGVYLLGYRQVLPRTLAAVTRNRDRNAN